jgi:hypothetical protein
MGNPFKKLANNAKETAKAWAGDKKEPGITSEKCPQCGAPRPANTNIANCSFCGFQFMTVDIIIKRADEL